jgi:hypothetical protein
MVQSPKKNSSCIESSILRAFWQHPRGREAFKDGKALTVKGFGKSVRKQSVI